MTPWQLRVAVAQADRSAGAALDRMLAQSWYTAALGRTRAMPDLAALLKRDARRAPQDIAAATRHALRQAAPEA